MPEEDNRITDFGLGLTDLVKKVAASNDAAVQGLYVVEGFVEKIKLHAPRWVAFHGKRAGSEVA